MLLKFVAMTTSEVVKDTLFFYHLRLIVKNYTMNVFVFDIFLSNGQNKQSNNF